MGFDYDQKYVSCLHAVRKAEFGNIFQSLSSNKLGRVLELGCGDGFQSGLLKGRAEFLVSTDFRSDAVSQQMDHSLNFLVCDVERLPFRGSAFDVIFSSNLLEHVESIDRALGEMRYCLSSGGMMIHTVPNVTWKIVQLLLFYPFIFWHGISSIIGSRNSQPRQGVHQATIRLESNIKGRTSDYGYLRRLCQKLRPPIHGVAKTHCDEIGCFSDSHWERVFTRNRLAIRARIKMPFYSPYAFGSEYLRKILEAVGLSSSRGYVLEVVSETGNTDASK